LCTCVWWVRGVLGVLELFFSSELVVRQLWQESHAYGFTALVTRGFQERSLAARAADHLGGISVTSTSTKK
jgi:hypothetical protein